MVDADLTENVCKRFDELLHRRSSEDHYHTTKLLEATVDSERLLQFIADRHPRVQATVHKGIQWMGKIDDYLELEKHPWNGVGESSSKLDW
jgi:hypothetical protein